RPIRNIAIFSGCGVIPLLSIALRPNPQCCSMGGTLRDLGERKVSCRQQRIGCPRDDCGLMLRAGGCAMHVASPVSTIRVLPEREISAARVVLETLVQRGVRVAFGIPGGLVSPLFDALADVSGLELVTTRHETMAGFAAMGHAIATGSPAIVLTTSGPGMTNAITGIAAA